MLNSWFKHTSLRFVILLLLILGNAGCDQISKRLVRDKVDAYAQIEVVRDRLMLTNVENTGAFLSLGAEWSGTWKNLFLAIIPAIVLSYMLFLVLFSRNLSTALSVGLAFITGGGIGNIYDRIRYGSVTDFLHLDFHFFETGIFNLADLSITFGTVIVLLSFITARHKS